MILPDVNLLLYAYRRELPNHEAAWQWWVSLIDGDEEVGIPWSVVVSFLRLMTNRRAMDPPITIDESIECVRTWFQYAHVTLLSPGPNHMNHFLSLLEAVQVGGNTVPDAHIAASAIENNAEVHTNDSGFNRFPGLRWHNPLQTVNC